MDKAGLHWIDLLIIVLSLLLSIGVGLGFSKKQSNTKQYFSAGGSVPSWAIGFSIFATLISSVTFLAYPGEGYSSNYVRLVQGLMVPLVVLAMIGFIVPMYRKVIGLSAYEYFERRFGYFARVYTALAFVLSHFSKMGSVFFLLSLAVASMTGIDTYVIIVVLGIAVIILTLKGGMEAVIWLDVIQGFLLICGGIITLVVISLKLEGGLGAVISTANAEGKMSLGPFDWDFVNLTFWVMAINGIFYAIQKYGTDQTIVQRYLTAKTDKDAKKASIMGVLMVVPIWAMFMFIGTALFVFYQQSVHTIPEGMRADEVFPYFILNEMPIGVIGLIISALLAAAISSLDSDLNCLAAVGVDDFYGRLYPKASDLQRMKVAKILVVISGLGAVLVAMVYVSAGDKGVLGIVFMLYAIFSGGIVGIFLLGIFVPRANKQGINIGIIACVIFTGYALLTSTSIGSGDDKRLMLDLGAYNFKQHKYMLGVYSHVILMVVGWLSSYFYPKPAINDNLTYRGWKRINRLATDQSKS